MFRFCLVTDRKQVRKGKNLMSIISKALNAGIDSVVLREKDLNADELYCLAKRVKKITGRKCRFLVNSRVDIALAVNADGVHLSSSSVPVSFARKILGKNKLIGVSCHSVRDAVRSRKEGADYIFLGPVYRTLSKVKYGKPLGVRLIREAKKKIRIPVIAIGGIKKENTAEVLKNGADGIAVISGIIKAKDVFGETKKYAGMLNGFRK